MLGQNGKLGHSCTKERKGKLYNSRVSDLATVHLGLNVSSYAHNCGCVVEGSGAVAAISVLLLLLTLGTHARGLQYLFCLCVCLCVCFPYSGTSHNQAYKRQYQRLQRDTGMEYKKGFFFKTLCSEVMASFTHLE